MTRCNKAGCASRRKPSGLATQAHTHDALRPIGKPRQASSRFLGQQGHKAALLIIELQGAMGGINPSIRITVHIQPGTASTTHPTAQRRSVSGLSAEGVSPIVRRYAGRLLDPELTSGLPPAVHGFSSLPLAATAIKFGTDGWRGILGVDITVERLLTVAAASAQELAHRAPAGNTSNIVVIGYDRRFLAPELAEAIAAAVRGCGLQPLLASTPVPTPPAVGRSWNDKHSAPW